jgi:hypothetical protein
VFEKDASSKSEIGLLVGGDQPGEFLLGLPLRLTIG